MNKTTGSSGSSKTDDLKTYPLEGYALETQALCKHFGALNVTDRVSLKLRPGVRQALIGPNGAGKTTLINLLSGAMEPSSGSIFLQGQDATHVPQAIRVQRGLTRTYQINSLFPGMTPLETLMIARLGKHNKTTESVRRLSSQSELQQQAYQHLSAVGLQDHALRPTKSLAYGQQRLLEIALTLACDPSILLLDEPAAGIPEAESQEVFRYIANLPEQLTLLFIEHDMSLVFRFAQRISVLAGGKLMFEGTPEQVSASALVKELYLGNDHG